MATHDYVIDNQAAPAFRADLNSVLQAIVSTNAAASAPATTYANMLWYDTANNRLEKRNEANSGWITIGTFDEGTGTFSAAAADTVDGKSFGTFTAAGGILYATAADAAAAIGAGTSGQVLTSAGAGAPTWTTPVTGGVTLLGTLTTTSGTTQTLSGLTLTDYKFLRLSFAGVSGSNGSGNQIGVTGLAAQIAANTTGSSGSWDGLVDIDLTTGSWAATLDSASAGAGGGPSTPYAGTGTITTASTSISVNLTLSGSFDAGSIKVYGVK